VGSLTIGPVPDDADVFVASGGPIRLVSSDAPGRVPMVSQDEGQSWAPLDTLSEASLARIVEENGEWVAYAAVFVEARDLGLVVRVPIGAPERGTVVLDLGSAPHRGGGSVDDSEAEQRIFALDVDVRAGSTELLVATEMGLYEVQVARGGQ
jgi:hypothetical protein